VQRFVDHSQFPIISLDLNSSNTQKTKKETDKQSFAAAIAAYTRASPPQVDMDAILTPLTPHYLSASFVPHSDPQHINAEASYGLRV
jgi:hypothetical protein